MWSKPDGTLRPLAQAQTWPNHKKREGRWFFGPEGRARRRVAEGL